tara:strand:+ start:1389 stop:1562 length:174 start_codon:yes stop_codon:yes gene_type:complete
MTTERMQKLLVRITLGDDPKGNDAEENDFIAEIKLEVAAIKASGGIVSIPNEYPDFG